MPITQHSKYAQKTRNLSHMLNLPSLSENIAVICEILVREGRRALSILPTKTEEHVPRVAIIE